MSYPEFESWRCAYDDRKFCPPEGCPKWWGCARMHGWQPDQPSPNECTGKRQASPTAAALEGK